MLRSLLQPWIRRLVAVFWLLRLGRTIMVAVITGVGAVAAGAGATGALTAAVGGWLLAVGGFSLDLYADRELDAASGRRRNPLAEGTLQPSTGLAISILFLLGSLVVVSRIPWGVVPWLAIVGIVAALARHLLDAPWARALSLGLLQGLYVLLGAMAGRLNVAVWLIAAMFFCAMVAGRGMTDIRDLPEDQSTPLQTLPMRYGVARTARFTAVGLAISFALSLAVYATGLFRPIYLCLDLAYIVVGLGCAIWFALRPSPRLAGILTQVCMIGLGGLISLAVILGRV